MKRYLTNSLVLRTSVMYLMAAVFFVSTPLSVSAAVTVDIKANGSDGPVTITDGDSYSYAWTSTGATTCDFTSPFPSSVTESGSNTVAAGSAFYYPTTGSPVTITVSCSDGVQTVTDSVVIQLGAAPSPVTVDIKANGSDGPVTITNGDSYVYNWTSSNATTCDFTSPFPSSVTLSGSNSVAAGSAFYYPTSGSPVTITVTCSNGSTSATDSVVIQLGSSPTPVTVDIKANGSDGPVTITDGDSYVYNWTSSNATSCDFTSPFPSSVTLSGGPNTVAAGSAFYYPTVGHPVTITVTCTNGSSTATDSVVIQLATITPVVTVDIKANGSDGPVTINNGDSYVYTWVSTNATSCDFTSPFPSSVTLSGGPNTVAAGSAFYYPTVGHPVTITVTCNNGSSTATDSVVIQLAPTTFCPLPTVTSALSASGVVGQAFSYTFTATTTGVATTTTKSLTGTLPPGLTYNATTGVISGTPTTAGTYSVSLTATNDCGSETKTLVITVTNPSVCPLPTITSPLTATGVVGQPFTYAIIATTTGATTTPTYTYSITGSLPSGLTFSSTTGVISGTPNAPGAFNVNIIVNNGCGGVTSTLVITVISGSFCPAPVITSALTASGTKGAAFSYAITATTTGVSATTTRFSMSGSLPAGLTFSSTTGVISGTPTVVGTFNVAITVTTDCGSDTKTLIITISGSGGCIPPSLSGSFSENVFVGSPFSYTISASGADTVTVSGLPAGLTYASSTRTISGTPTAAGTFNVLITAANDCGNASQTLIILVKTPSSGCGGCGGGGGGGTPPAPQVLGVTTTNFCPFLSSYMGVGRANDMMEVIRLQAFLKVFEKADYVTVNGVYDQATVQAVSAFQLKYKDEILTPWGISAPTGYAYIRTIGKINQIICGSAIPAVHPAAPHAPGKVLGKEAAGFKEGAGTSTLNSIPTIGQNVDKGQISPQMPLNEPDSVAASVFSWPHSGLQILQCLYELLLILLVLYIIGNVLENVLYKDNKENVLKRFYTKWSTICIGLALAFGLAYYLKQWCLLLPLIVAFLGALTYLFIGRRKFVTVNKSAEPVIILASK